MRYYDWLAIILHRVVLFQVIILIFAMGIMLMIGAQVARVESEPGLSKYMKEVKRLRETEERTRTRLKLQVKS